MLRAGTPVALLPGHASGDEEPRRRRTGDEALEQDHGPRAGPPRPVPDRSHLVDGRPAGRERAPAGNSDARGPSPERSPQHRRADRRDQSHHPARRRVASRATTTPQLNTHKENRDDHRHRHPPEADARAPERHRYPDAPDHDQRGRGPARAREVPVSRREPLADGDAQPYPDPLLQRRRRRAGPRQGVHVRRRPPAGARRQGSGPDPRGVPAPRARGMPHRRHRQHRRRARRDADRGGIAGRGRHRPPGHPRPVRQGAERLPADPRELHDQGRRAAGRAREDRRAVAQAVRRVRRPDQRRPRHGLRERGMTFHPGRPAGSRVARPVGRTSNRGFPMARTDVIVIGAGQAGLAMSRHLADRGIDHAVLERGHVAERWRSERWDSLHLLTPRWQSRLPGWSYLGPDPDGYMTRNEVTRYLEDYSRSFSAPVHIGAAVEAVERGNSGFRVMTTAGPWQAQSVVIATGHCDRATIPPFAAGLAPDILQVVPTAYRNAGQLPDGPVLVVGASSTGIQLASEIGRSGRHVTLAVGGHTRLPRHYRGLDIMAWLDTMGV